MSAMDRRIRRRRRTRRSTMEPPSQADLAFGRGKHSGHTGALGAGQETVEAVTQLGGQFGQRANGQQQEGRDGEGIVGRFESGHLGHPREAPWRRNRPGHTLTPAGAVQSNCSAFEVSPRAQPPTLEALGSRWARLPHFPR